jgi:hypothetical protein
MKQLPLDGTDVVVEIALKDGVSEAIAGQQAAVKL